MLKRKQTVGVAAQRAHATAEYLYVNAVQAQYSCTPLLLFHRINQHASGNSAVFSAPHATSTP